MFICCYIFYLWTIHKINVNYIKFGSICIWLFEYIELVNEHLHIKQPQFQFESVFVTARIVMLMREHVEWRLGLLMIMDVLASTSCSCGVHMLYLHNWNSIFYINVKQSSWAILTNHVLLSQRILAKLSKMWSL